jgi:hypothetical protein
VLPLTINFATTDHEQATLTINGYAYPDDPRVYDYKWLSAQFTVRIDAFQAKVEHTLELGEIEDFLAQLQQLHETLRGSARLETLEKWLHMNVIANHYGHIRITGVVSHIFLGNPIATLQFELAEMDQSYLPAFMQQLERVCSAYRQSG